MKLIMSAYPGQKMKGKEAYIFAFSKEQLLVIEKNERCRIPRSSEFKTMNLSGENKHYLGVLDTRPCYAVDLVSGDDLPVSSRLIGLRTLFGQVDDDLFSTAGYAFQIINWARMNRYCGRCGKLTEYASLERTKVCKECEAVYYPKICPAIIVAVRRGKELLLARNQAWKNDFYSVVAGFVEAGESLEECLVREVREETGIEVKNIRYFGSQSWPFPNSLMIGFTADYAGGEIRLDGREIEAAGWFSPENLPQLPGSISIARQLIDAFLDEQKA